ncbi:MAG: hypothetical protein JXB05_07435 [Myxococcaceae bacterium]|nr:hypothetical protein [Myxococcaceae bacterium]
MEDRYKALRVVLSGAPEQRSVTWAELVESLDALVEPLREPAAVPMEREPAWELLEQLLSHRGWVPATPFLPHVMPPLDLLKAMALEELEPRLLGEERFRKAVRAAADTAQSPALKAQARSLLKSSEGG